MEDKTIKVIRFLASSRWRAIFSEDTFSLASSVGNRKSGWGSCSSGIFYFLLTQSEKSHLVKYTRQHRNS